MIISGAHQGVQAILPGFHSRYAVAFYVGLVALRLRFLTRLGPSSLAGAHGDANCMLRLNVLFGPDVGKTSVRGWPRHEFLIFSSN
jgi:hypothetical protein